MEGDVCQAAALADCRLFHCFHWNYPLYMRCEEGNVFEGSFYSQRIYCYDYSAWNFADFNYLCEACYPSVFHSSNPSAYCDYHSLGMLDGCIYNKNQIRPGY